jgi:hypothetical protein
VFGDCLTPWILHDKATPAGTIGPGSCSKLEYLRDLLTTSAEKVNWEVTGTMVTTLLMCMMMLVCGPRARLTSETAQNRDFTERDEFNQTYRLAPGARVEVSSIRGPVEIVNGDNGTAEVQIIRTARTRTDLEYHKVEIEQTGDGLVIRGVQEPEQRQRQNIRVDHIVRLKVPRHIDLAVKSISGWIKVGDVDGETYVNSISGPANLGNVGGKLHVNSISGNLTVRSVGADARVNSVSGNLNLGQINGSLEVLSVSGAVSVTLASLSPQGINIKSVSGSIEIAFKGEINADFSAESVNGEVYLNVPNVIRESGENSSNVRARIGAGGTPIRILSVTGNIRLKLS